jgi:hypothetical protein
LTFDFYILTYLNRLVYFLKNLYTYPAAMAPAIGATINNQSCAKALLLENKAWLILLAGFTDVLVTGIVAR